MNSKHLCRCLTAGMFLFLIGLHIPGKTQPPPARRILAAKSKLLTAIPGIHEATRPAQLTSDAVQNAANAVLPTMAHKLTAFLKAVKPFVNDKKRMDEQQLLLEQKGDMVSTLRIGLFMYGMDTYNLFYQEYPTLTQRSFDALVKEVLANTVSNATQQNDIQLMMVPLLLDKHLVSRLQSAPGFPSSRLTKAWLTAVARDSNTLGKPTSFIQIVSNLLVLNDALDALDALSIVPNVVDINDMLVAFEAVAEVQEASQQRLAQQLQQVSMSLQKVPVNLWTLRDDIGSSADTTASVAELRFSSDPYRFDIAFQEIFGDIHGYGGRLLLDISEAGIRVADAARSSQETARSCIQLFPKNDKPQGKLTAPKQTSLIQEQGKSAEPIQTLPIPEMDYPRLADNLYQAIREKDRLVNATIDAYLAPRSAFSVSGQHINEYGTLFDLGYDTSKLVGLLPNQALADRDYPGISYNLSLHGSFYDPNSGLHTAVAPNIGLGIAWQNVVPFHQASTQEFESPLLLSFSLRQSDGKLLRLPPVRHWSVQTGLVFRYYMKSDPDPGGAAGLYVRYRDRKHFLEVSAQVGIDQDQHGYFSAGTAVSW